MSTGIVHHERAVSGGVGSYEGLGRRRRILTRDPMCPVHRVRPAPCPGFGAVHACVAGRARLAYESIVMTALASTHGPRQSTLGGDGLESGMGRPLPPVDVPRRWKFALWTRGCDLSRGTAAEQKRVGRGGMKRGQQALVCFGMQMRKDPGCAYADGMHQQNDSRHGSSLGSCRDRRARPTSAM